VLLSVTSEFDLKLQLIEEDMNSAVLISIGFLCLDSLHLCGRATTVLQFVYDHCISVWEFDRQCVFVLTFCL